MFVEHKNDGKYIPYEVDGNRICIDDEITLNLAKYEKDEDTCIDVCRTIYGNLITGVVPGLAEQYVAQILIPGRQYVETVEKISEEELATRAEGGEGDMNSSDTKVARTPVAFNPDNCTIVLWAI